MPSIWVTALGASSVATLAMADTRIGLARTSAMSPCSSARSDWASASSSCSSPSDFCSSPRSSCSLANCSCWARWSALSSACSSRRVELLVQLVAPGPRPGRPPAPSWTPSVHRHRRLLPGLQLSWGTRPGPDPPVGRRCRGPGRRWTGFGTAPRRGPAGIGQAVAGLAQRPAQLGPLVGGRLDRLVLLLLGGVGLPVGQILLAVGQRVAVLRQLVAPLGQRVPLVLQPVGRPVRGLLLLQLADRELQRGDLLRAGLVGRPAA